MKTYAVMYEQADDGGWCASAVDLPVFAFGATRSEAERQIKSAIAFHLDGLQTSGDAPDMQQVEYGVVSI